MNNKQRRKLGVRTIKIGNKFSDIKEKHIHKNRLNQIIVTYKTPITKNKIEVSVIVKNKKDLKRKLLTLKNWKENSGQRSKIVSITRYLVMKPKKNKR